VGTVRVLSSRGHESGGSSSYSFGPHRMTGAPCDFRMCHVNVSGVSKTHRAVNLIQRFRSSWSSSRSRPSNTRLWHWNSCTRDPFLSNYHLAERCSLYYPTGDVHKCRLPAEDRCALRCGPARELQADPPWPQVLLCVRSSPRVYPACWTSVPVGRTTPHRACR